MVEASFRILLEAVTSHQDFDAVQRAHASYLASMTRKSHLGVKPLLDGLRRLFRICRHFAALLNSFSDLSDVPHAEVEALSEQFRSDAAYLFLMLERTDAKELATRLDYNAWFSKTAEKLTGGVGR